MNTQSVYLFLVNLDKSFTTFLKAIDIFGRKTQLKMSRRSRFKTKIGGFFTLIMITLCMLLFFSFGSDMLYHENPTAIFSQIFVPEPSRTYFSKDNYFFMFGVQLANFSQFIDESIYTVTVFNRRVGKNNDSFVKEVEVGRCTEDMLPADPKMKDYFNGATPSPVSDLYCLKDIDNYFIEGSFDTEEYTFLEIYVYACQNSSNQTICKSNEEIASKLNGFFALFTMDYLIDPQKYTEPGQAIGTDYFTPLSVGIERYTNRYIADTKVISDDGFLFSDQKTYNYPTYSYDKESLLLDTGDSGLLMYFLLRKAHNEIVYERMYKKLQNILAEIGGIIQILYLFFYALSYPSVSKLYFEKIINSIYHFEMEDDEKVENESSRWSIFKKIMPLKKAFNNTLKKHKTPRRDAFNSNHFMDENMKKHLEKKNKEHLGMKLIFEKTLTDLGESTNKMYMGRPLAFKSKLTEKKNEEFLKYMMKIQKRPPLKTTFWEYIKGQFYYFRTKSTTNVENHKELENVAHKLIRLKAARFAIKEKLDISYILKKFYELDKLKMLLLNEDQYHLFEYSSKPVVLKNSKIDVGHSKNSLSISYENDVVGKANKMYRAYKNIKKQREVSELDKRLIELLDDNIKSVLEVYLIKVYFNKLLLGRT